MVKVLLPLTVTLGLAAVKLRLLTVKSASSVVVRFAPLAAVKYTSLMLPGNAATERSRRKRRSTNLPY